MRLARDTLCFYGIKIYDSLCDHHLRRMSAILRTCNKKENFDEHRCSRFIHKFFIKKKDIRNVTFLIIKTTFLVNCIQIKLDLGI